MRLISVCSLFLETKLDQTDTSSDSTISDADQSGDDGNETTASEKAVKRKKASKVKRFMFWKGVGYSGRFFYIPHHPSLSNVQINYFSSAKKKRRASKLSAQIEMLECKNERKA